MKSKNDHYWLKSGALNVLQNISSVFFGFGSFYLLVRMLDKHSFGTWTLFMATTTIFEMIRSGLIQNALIKFLSFSERSEHDKILSASFTMSGVLTLACIIINLCLANYLAVKWDSPELVNMFYMYSFVYIFSGILSQFHWIEQANLTFQGIFITNFIRQGVFFVFIVIAFFTKFKIQLIYLVYVQAFCALLSASIEYRFIKKFLRFTYSVSLEWVKKLFNYGKFAFGTSISSILSNTIDQMMLGAILSPAASGAFNIAVRITNLVDIPTNSIAVIVFPQSAKRLATEGKEGIKYLYEKSVGTILAILIPGLLFLYFFPTFVVHVIAGNQYAETIPILKITTLYCLLIPFGRQFGTILDSIGRPKITFIIVVLTATLNLTLNYFMIKQWGVMGAAYATLTSNVIAFAVAQFILYKELKVNIANTFIYAYMFYPEFYNKYVKPRLVRTKG
ncbi:flippase [Chitinophagaceae bacterium LWZ2-11]